MLNSLYGFAGLFAVIALAYIILSQEQQVDREMDLIRNNSPQEVAEKAFRDNKIVFYEVWFEWHHPEGRVDRRWKLPGQEHIPPSILADYPARHQVQATQNQRLDPEHVMFNREARRWAGVYNAQLAKLLTDAREP